MARIVFHILCGCAWWAHTHICMNFSKEYTQWGISGLQGAFIVAFADLLPRVCSSFYSLPPPYMGIISGCWKTYCWSARGKMVCCVVLSIISFCVESKRKTFILGNSLKIYHSCILSTLEIKGSCLTWKSLKNLANVINNAKWLHAFLPKSGTRLCSHHRYS